MSRQNAERAGLVFGPQVRDVLGIDDDGERRGHGEPHGASTFASASLRRASSRSPTM